MPKPTEDEVKSALAAIAKEVGGVDKLREIILQIDEKSLERMASAANCYPIHMCPTDRQA